MEGEGRMGQKGREEGRERADRGREGVRGRERAGTRRKIENPLAPGSPITK